MCHAPYASMAKTIKFLSEIDKTLLTRDRQSAQEFPRQADLTQMSLLHSAAALIYSALALAETFVLLAVVLGVFWLVARAILRMFRKD